MGMCDGLKQTGKKKRIVRILKNEAHSRELAVENPIRQEETIARSMPAQERIGRELRREEINLLKSLKRKVLLATTNHFSKEPKER